MDIIFNDSKPKYVQLFEHIKDLINTGYLKSNEKLPSKRDLSLDLNVSLNTVVNAYNLLIDEGYIYTINKKGYYVTSQLMVTNSSRVDFDEQNISFNYQYNFTTESINTYPKAIKKIYRELLDSDSFYNKEPLLGNVQLRKTICNHIKENRGISCTYEQILIVSGMEAFEQILSIIDNDNIILENPGYHKLKGIATNCNKKISYVDIDDEGAKVPSYDGILYLTDFNQFPTGIKMSISRKKEIVHWALTANNYIIEDDFDAEYRINSSPTTSIYSLASNNTIFFSTFSTTIYPGLRIAYVILPTNLLVKYNNKYKSYSNMVPSINQLMLKEFINSGLYARHINKQKKKYLKRRELLINAIADTKYLSYDLKKNYLSLIVNISADIDYYEFKEMLKKYSIKISFLGDFYNDARTDLKTLILGYTDIADEQIFEGIKLIDSIIQMIKR